MQFDEIASEDFTSFKPGVVMPHVQIEQALAKIGGGGTAGTEFKNTVIKKAGWKYDPIIGYAKNPPLASEAFNKVRALLSQTEDKDELLSKLG